LLVECREGVPLGREAFYEMDAIVAAQMKKGQHLYHISRTQNLGVSAICIRAIFPPRKWISRA
jgi:hypothetical protein